MVTAFLTSSRYISNIEMPGGKIVYVPMHPPKTGATKTSSAGDWTIDFAELEQAITPKTKMIVLNTPRTFFLSIEGRLVCAIVWLTMGRQPRRQGLLQGGAAEDW